jgi:hypothetical protein
MYKNIERDRLLDLTKACIVALPDSDPSKQHLQRWVEHTPLTILTAPAARPLALLALQAASRGTAPPAQPADTLAQMALFQTDAVLFETEPSGRAGAVLAAAFELGEGLKEKLGSFPGSSFGTPSGA